MAVTTEPTLPVYNYLGSEHLNWIQRLRQLDPQLMQYFYQQLRQLLVEEKIMIDFSQQMPTFLFANGELSELIRLVTITWQQQGCPILNLENHISQIMEDAGKLLLAEQTTAQPEA